MNYEQIAEKASALNGWQKADEWGEELAVGEYDVQYIFEDFNDKKDFEPSDVAEVLKAACHSPEGWGSIDLAIVVKLNDGRWGVIAGWADTTGWGCQCGGEVTAFPTEDEMVRFGLTDEYRRWLGYEQPVNAPS